MNLPLFELSLTEFIIMKKTLIVASIVIVNLTGNIWAQQQQPFPCDSKEAHQFDFWIGDWDVYATGTETIIGHNTITPIANGCAVLENWTGGGGSIGSSINKFNFATKVWEQMWVDNSGSSLHIKGVYADAKMVLENEQPARKGNGTVKNKITYCNNADGTVRQHWEFSTDQGKTWQSSFDGLYKKVKKQNP